MKFKGWIISTTSKVVSCVELLSSSSLNFKVMTILFLNFFNMFCCFFAVSTLQEKNLWRNLIEKKKLAFPELRNGVGLETIDIVMKYYKINQIISSLSMKHIKMLIIIIYHLLSLELKRSLFFKKNCALILFLKFSYLKITTLNSI